MKSKVMYLIALSYVVAGWQVYSSKIPTETYRKLDPSITAHTNVLTLHQIGLLFMGTSVLCAVLTWRNKVETAYGVMTFLLSFWALLYVVSWIQTGYWQSVYGAAGYVLTSSILILVSRFVELPKNMQGTEDSFESLRSYNVLNQDKKEGGPA